MCGIAGFNWNSQVLIEQMLKTLRHRGPDDEGFLTDSNATIGNTRLAVMDPSDKGHQPMNFEHLAIVYNGEIYGFKQLREELEAEGYRFVSDTDTEVVLCSYHRWGPNCVARFNGMWAFCIYDRKENTLFLSRDRFGIKPLYYCFRNGKFIFASELKAIRQHDPGSAISVAAVNYFFYQKYIGDHLSIYEDCYKLRPSENLLFDLGRKQLTLRSYYDLEREVTENQDLSLAERLGSVESTIIDAVEKRLVADVPVGSFLSGGLDSSLISSIIARRQKGFETFSIGFKEDESYDEVKYSNLASEHINTSHYVDYVGFNEETVRFVLDNMDEPFGDASVFPTYLLCKMTRARVTAALSGDAADEVFGGYDTYKAYKLAQYVPRTAIKASKRLIDLLPPSDRKMTFTFKLKRFVRDSDLNSVRRHLRWMATFNDLQRPKLLKCNFVAGESLIPCGSERSLLALQLSDIHNYLAEDILKKVDMASMLNSLEVRLPYLDHRLVPVVLSLPEKYKVRNLGTKWLLKRIAAKYLPKSIVRRRKRGFTAPVSRWIKCEGFIQSFLKDRRYYEHDLLDYNHAQKLFEGHINNRQDNARELWLIFVFNYWWNCNCNG